MKRLARRGSLSIFLCLVMSAAVLFLGTLVHAARIRAAEHDLYRGLKAQIQASLCCYNRDLRAFGLFGFQSDVIDPSVFRSTVAAGLKNSTPVITPGLSLNDPAVLDGQITRHMKGRLPAVYAQLLISRLAASRQGLAEPLNLALQAGSEVTDNSMQIDRHLTADAYSGSGFQGLLSHVFSEIPGGGLQEAAQSLFGDAAADLENELIGQTEQLYRQYAAEFAGSVSDKPISSVAPEESDWLNPTSLSALAGSLDHLLDFKTVPVYEKACLVEYVLGYFRSTVDQMDRQPIKTIDGRAFQDFPDSRRFEVEQILTGLDTPESARKAIKAILTGLRSIIHLVWILTDQQQIGQLRTAATALSASLLILSTGTAAIDPEIILYLLVVGRAIGGGMADYASLAAGKSVEIWPGESPVNVRLYYQDYLRLLLMAVARATLLDRVGLQLSRIFQTPHYTSLEVAVAFRGRRYALQGDYQG